MFRLAACLDLLFIFKILLTDARIYPLWSSTHLDDLTISSYTPAIVALYESECSDELFAKYEFAEHSLPPPTQLIMARFDRTAAQSESWMDWNQQKPDWDLFSRYNISTVGVNMDEWCPTIVYQPVDWDWDGSFTVYNPLTDGRFIDWSWRMLQMNVMFTNDLAIDESVYISVEARRNGLSASMIDISEIKPAQSSIVSLQLSDIIVVWNGAYDIVTRVSVDYNSTRHAITISGVTNEADILDVRLFDAHLREAVMVRMQQNWMVRRRYLINTYIPPSLTRYTDLGFRHDESVPPEVCEFLAQYYAANKDTEESRTAEAYNSNTEYINVAVHPTYLVRIPEDKQKWIGDAVKPIVEEWSQTKLKLRVTHGVRQYIRGAAVKPHTDNVNNTAVSVIIHVSHDPVDVNWPLEVYGFDKQIHYVEQEACSMTLYEATTLVHGRPMPFAGKSWLTTFIDYQLASDQEQTFMTLDNFVIPAGHNIRVPIYDDHKYG